jgi:hypothetical protein
MPLRIAFVEWPKALSTCGAHWTQLKDSLTAALTGQVPISDSTCLGSRLIRSYDCAPTTMMM